MAFCSSPYLWKVSISLAKDKDTGCIIPVAIILHIQLYSNGYKPLLTLAKLKERTKTSRRFNKSNIASGAQTSWNG